MPSAPSTEFMNEVRAEQKRGLSYNQAFNRVQRQRPDLLRKMHRAGTTNDKRSIHGFVNAASNPSDLPLGKNLSDRIPQAVTSVLGLTKGMTDAQLTEAIANSPGKLPNSTAKALWLFCVNTIRVEGNLSNISVATTAAKKAFPALAKEVNA